MCVATVGVVFSSDINVFLVKFSMYSLLRSTIKYTLKK